MHAIKTKAKPSALGLFWLGLAALLPVLTGCNTLNPRLDDIAANAPPVPICPGALPIPHAPATPDNQDPSAVRQARFDMARFQAENEGVHAVPETLPPAEKMTFDQAIQATLTADPKLRAGLEVITQARADLRTSSLLPNPSITVDGLFLSYRPFTADRPGGPPQTDVQVNYPIDWFVFGKRAAAMASAQIGVHQSQSDYADLVRQRIIATASAFYDVAEAKALLELARQDVKNLSEFASRTERAVREGGKALVDLNRIRLDLLKSEQAVREAEAAVVVAKGKLRSLFGRTDADPDFDVAVDLEGPVTAEPIELEKAYALAQENRPDIQSMRFQVARAQADVVVEDRKKWPQVTPGVGYTRQYQQSQGLPDADSVSLTNTMTLPVTDRNQGNRRKAQSVAVQNRFLLESALVDLRAEITQARSDFETAYKNTQAIGQEQKKTAQAVLDSIIKGKEFGGRPIIDVLDAERSYRETYRAYISSRANYWRAVYQFSAAMGKQIE